MKNMKKAYLAPMVEVMNARVEKGFAGSGSSSNNDKLPHVTPQSGATMMMGGLASDFD